MDHPGAKHQAIRSKLGGLPRPFWVLFGGTVVNRLGTMVEPFIGVYLTRAHGMSITAAGLVMAVFGAGSLLSQPLAGWLADRIGRRATLTGGMLTTAVTMVLLGYSTTVPALVCAMFVLGVAVDAYRPASQALVADLVDPLDRPRAYGLLFWAVNLGFSGSMVAGGWLAEAGFSWLFWINALTCAVFGTLVWRAIPEVRQAADAERGGFRDVLRDRLMVGCVLVNLVYMFVYLQAYTTLPLAMADRGLPTSAYGIAMSINGLLIVVFQPLTLGRLSRLDPSRVLATGFAVIGAGFALTASVSSALGYTVTVAVWTVGEIVAAGMASTIVASLAPAHLRGRYAGLYGSAWSAGSLLAPLIGTRLLAVDPHLLWLTTGTLGLLAALGQLALAPAVRRRARIEETVRSGPA